MKIVGIALGTYGDVEPFVILGCELLKRGYEFELIAFESAVEQIQRRNIKVTIFPGECEKIVRALYAKENSTADIGNIITEFYREILDNRNIAIERCKDAGLIIYMQFGNFIRHFAHANRIPCIRTSVFPDTKTKLYSVMSPLCKRGSIKCALQYSLELIAINMPTIKQTNIWRKEMGLNKIIIFSSDRNSAFGEIPTLYQYSKALAPPDPKWSALICVTGVWEESNPVTYKGNKELEHFLAEGNVIYIGFGSMLPKNMKVIQNVVEEALHRLKIKAIISLQGGNFARNNNTNVFYTDFVPYDWLFPKVKAVICHGGCGTIHKAMKYGVPTLVAAFGGDQLFWGLQAENAGAGAYPINMKKDEITVEMLSNRIERLFSKDCKTGAKKIQQLIEKENGTKDAADFIESYIKEIGKSERRKDARHLIKK